MFKEVNMLMKMLHTMQFLTSLMPAPIAERKVEDALRNLKELNHAIRIEF